MATAVESYRPPPPIVETPQEVGVWTETQDNLLESLQSWKPLKKVSQEDRDWTLGQAHDQVASGEVVTPSPTALEEGHRGASLIQGIPAGLESDVEVRSQLDEFSPEEEAFSDHLKGPALVEDDEEPLEQYLRTRSPRPPSPTRS